MNNLYALIMAGGKGSRLWPKSRSGSPKHSLCFNSDFSLLQETFNRARDLVEVKKIFVVTTRKQARLIKKQLPLLKRENLIIEPDGKNTLPCILLAALLIKKRDKNGVIAVFPSDHIIEPRGKFLSSLKAAAEFAGREDNIVTFGVKPDYPETGYGYIKISNQKTETLPCRQAGSSRKIYKVDKFIEKPDLKTAERLFKRKDLFWNAGIFVFKASAILKETAALAPSIFGVFKKLIQGNNSPAMLESVYKKIPAVSIDRAILEKSDSCFMVQADFLWSDLGNWESVGRIFAKDRENNLNIGENLLHKTRNSIIINEQNNHLIATLGLDNITVVHTPCVTLVKERSSAQGLRELVDILGKNKRHKKYI